MTKWLENALTSFRSDTRSTRRRQAMPDKKPYGSVGNVHQSEPKIIENKPQKTVAAALASGKAQVDQAKRK